MQDGVICHNNVEESEYLVRVSLHESMPPSSKFPIQPINSRYVSNNHCFHIWCILHLDMIFTLYASPPAKSLSKCD